MFQYYNTNIFYRLRTQNLIMPSRKSLKIRFIGTVIFIISLLAIIHHHSHLSNNFWERYVMQKDLVNVKSSLLTVKVRFFKINCWKDFTYK